MCPPHEAVEISCGLLRRKVALGQGQIGGGRPVEPTEVVDLGLGDGAVAGAGVAHFVQQPLQPPPARLPLL